MRRDPLVIRISDDGFLVVQPQVIATIRANVGSRDGFTEAGGILIGSYRGSHIEIADCTVPKPRDVRRRTLFDRLDIGHQQAAMKAWRTSGKTDSYVGEWHTHPQDHPNHSSLDRRTWDGLMSEAREPLIFCIAGWQSTWWGVGHHGLRELSRQGAGKPIG